MNTENTAINNHPFAPNAADLATLVDHYEKSKTLPTNYVQCTKSGRMITMFGTNLTNRVAKFGGIENLLTTFICKDQVKLDKSAGIVHIDQPKSAAGFKKKVVDKDSLLAQIAALTAMLATMPETPRVEEAATRSIVPSYDAIFGEDDAALENTTNDEIVAEFEEASAE